MWICLQGVSLKEEGILCEPLNHYHCDRLYLLTFYSRIHLFSLLYIAVRFLFLILCDLYYQLSRYSILNIFYLISSLLYCIIDGIKVLAITAGIIPYNGAQNCSGIRGFEVMKLALREPYFDTSNLIDGLLFTLGS